MLNAFFESTYTSPRWHASLWPCQGASEQRDGWALQTSVSQPEWLQAASEKICHEKERQISVVFFLRFLDFLCFVHVLKVKSNFQTMLETR